MRVEACSTASAAWVACYALVTNRMAALKFGYLLLCRISTLLHRYTEYAKPTSHDKRQCRIHMVKDGRSIVGNLIISYVTRRACIYFALHIDPAKRELFARIALGG